MSGILNFMYQLIQKFGNAVIKLLPASPFRSFIDNFQVPQYLGWLNWFIPVPQIIAILNIWLAAITLFYLYSIIMRWVKMIGD